MTQVARELLSHLLYSPAGRALASDGDCGEGQGARAPPRGRAGLKRNGTVRGQWEHSTWFSIPLSA